MAVMLPLEEESEVSLVGDVPRDDIPQTDGAQDEDKPDEPSSSQSIPTVEPSIDVNPRGMSKDSGVGGMTDRPPTYGQV